ncbi:4-(cytidine 5'-diphospho)-2-C-methyl-D-erythritol kinase [Sphingomonas sp.]|jgi:4-diphosphocytidyl-2-C-methyl-D-erythritol kinase|uniref:4-(cytidine 5'-diphospho)-2-C-methyl-D-erythritol kinase n=1 Tax=Sphingomonas sp. TaxID=28214 RepID=UPI002E353926|nr:4-(cytidine 5'-diphospho)-2-C-methyl-D-erythritol kinase [Sphingomonas sp.]HEX4693696.1 4-(cytidine 5'-diphospho)-2-C-methyl-D-erythritol kinase [Sphingomonas sp.]
MIAELAPAKINLALHVRARRPDGYHEIETLFAFCRDGDSVTVAEAGHDSFTITGPFADALAGESGNLVLAARDAFAAAFGALPPLTITLDKRLPVASGIAGGSADAAAILRALGRLRGVVPEDMAEIALALGSDVPACLLGRSAYGRGRGEQLEPVDGLAGRPILLVNPGVAVSTASAFAAWDGIDRGPLVADAASRNDLEAPARAIAPAIGDVLDLLSAQVGATLTRMSGSGATCFALFESEQARADAHASIALAHPDWWCLESALA